MEDGKENLDEDGQPRGMPPSAEAAASPEAASDEPGGSVDSAISRLVDLLYFSQVRVTRCCCLGLGQAVLRAAFLSGVSDATQPHRPDWHGAILHRLSVRGCLCAPAMQPQAHCCHGVELTACWCCKQAF